MTWVIAAVILLAGVVVVVWLSRSSGAPGWHDPVRSEVLRSLLAARGLDAQIATKAPASLPDTRLPLAWGWRSRAAAQAATADDEVWLLYDSESRGRNVAGCNAEVISGGDSSTIVNRHTVAAFRSDKLVLPRFTLVPNVRRQLGEALPERLRRAGLGDSSAARFATKLTSALTALGEQGAAAPFPASREFERAFRVTSDDDAEAVTHLFDDETVTLLLAHPWAILDGQGAWLAASRNTAAAFATRPEDNSDGLLSPESAAELLELTAQVAARWTRAR
jgi:hypothetical protein